MPFLDLLFRFFVRSGALTVIYADGRKRSYGDGKGPAVTIKLHDRRIYSGLFLFPNLHLGEAYMDGLLTVEEGDLYEFLHILALNQRRLRRFFLGAVIRKGLIFFDFLIQNNTLQKAKKRVSHHYDISNEIYGLFLDADRQYSCAYFRDENGSLEQAQIDKKARLMAKLRLADGQRVLDIGCGWGGLAIALAERYKVKVVGVTLSREQYELAKKRVRDKGLEDRVEILLKDYRELDGTFDRIVSVGMFEHVGKPHYKEFFDKVRSLLPEDGIAVLHTIGYKRPIGATNPWIDKYIFPGSYVPALSECLPPMEKADFWVSDIEILHRHYSYTLREWRKRFVANKAKIIEEKDETFFRMFELYLTGCEVAFLYGEMTVFQFQLVKAIETVPLSRDYMGFGDGSCP